MIDHIYEPLDGWFNFGALYDEWAQNVPRNGHIVEVGVFQGRSLMYLAVELARRGRSDVTLHAFDQWKRSEGHYSSENYSLQHFEKTIAQLAGIPGAPKVIPYQALSTSIHLYPHTFADYVFIDADHEVEAVFMDCSLWWEIVKPGGQLAGHDWEIVHPAVRRFAFPENKRIEILPESGPSYFKNWSSWRIKKHALPQVRPDWTPIQF